MHRLVVERSGYHHEKCAIVARRADSRCNHGWLEGTRVSIATVAMHNCLLDTSVSQLDLAEACGVCAAEACDMATTYGPISVTT